MSQNHNERLQITVTRELAAKIRAASRRRCQTVSQYIAEQLRESTKNIKPGRVTSE